MRPWKKPKWINSLCKDMDNILSTILKDTYSIHQLRHRLNILKNSLLENFFNSPSQSLTQADLSWLKSLPPALLSQFNKDNIYTIFGQLQKEITTLKLLVIYLTFEPDNDSLANIGNYTRKLYGLSLLLDIKYDPNLIAGAALVWKGVYKDYSLRAKIEEKKSEVSESFKKFLR